MKAWSNEEIKEFRKRLDLKQSEMAELLGVSTNYVHLLEKGDRQPSQTLKLLLDCIEYRLRGPELLRQKEHRYAERTGDNL